MKASGKIKDKKRTTGKYGLGKMMSLNNISAGNAQELRENVVWGKNNNKNIKQLMWKSCSHQTQRQMCLNREGNPCTQFDWDKHVLYLLGLFIPFIEVMASMNYNNNIFKM